MDIEELKEYLRVDFDDDDAVIQLMLDAVLDEMEEVVPKFDRDAPTNRQKLLIFSYVKEVYDGRGEHDGIAGEDAIRGAVHDAERNVKVTGWQKENQDIPEEGGNRGRQAEGASASAAP